MSLRKQMIVFFDGDCSFCSSSVQFIHKRDRKQQFYFAPLQGETAQTLLANKLPFIGDSVVLYKGGQAYVEADAVLNICSELGRGWKLLTVANLLPESFRNFCYRFIAERRQQLQKSNRSCRLSHSLRLRMLR